MTHGTTADNEALGQERETLGAAIMEPELFGSLDVSGEMFVQQAIGRSFDCLKGAWETGIPVDSIETIRALLTEAGTYEGIGGRAGLIEIATNTPTAASAQYHARLIRERYQARQNELAQGIERKREGGPLVYAVNRTDIGTAKRFVNRYQKQIMSVPPWKKYLTWDGKRWYDDNGIGVSQRAKRFSESQWQFLTEAARHVDSRELAKIQTFVRSINQRKNIDDYLAVASSDSRIVCFPDALNTDPMLLNVQNGTVDLRTGELRPHAPEDRLTQLASVAYDPSALCPEWEKTIRLIMRDNTEMVDYLQMLLGYSISGDTGEHLLPIIVGSGANGKSTIWNVVMDIIGDYGMLANDDLLLGEKSNHPTEKAALYQKRFVAISEPNQGSKLKESRVKELTGDRTITARRMREDFWSFERTHTFWLSTNHLPRISGTDDGIWRRIKIIPALVDLRKAVTPIPDFDSWLVKNEGPGILAWLIEGYLKYHRDGLAEPEMVTTYTEQYRDDSDPLTEFINDCCDEVEGGEAGAAELFNAYEKHGGTWSKTAFGKAMAERFSKTRSWAGGMRGKWVYQGLQMAETSTHTPF